MDIHKPKPWHGVREFLKEYAIIVVGVLTALGAEQGVQALDWQRRVADAEHDLNAELHANAVNAFERLASARCATEQIGGIRHALVESRDKGTAVPPFPPYRRGNRAWLTDNWESAKGLQLTGHIPTERLHAYSVAYALTATFREQQHNEQDLKPGVDSLIDNAGRLNAAERDRLFLAVRALEAQSNRLDNVAFRYLEAMKPLGITLEPKVRAEHLKSQQGFNGPCAQDPSPWLNDGQKAVDWLLSRNGEP